MRGMIDKVQHLVRVDAVVGMRAVTRSGEHDEAQRDQGQSGRALPREARRARHRLGQGQDLGPRRQGPDRAHRRRAQRLRGRPDAAASPAAEARLQQQDLPEGLQGREPRPAAAGARRRQARAPSGTIDGKQRWSRPACCAGSATACACSPRASSRRRSRSRSPAPRRRRSRRSRRPAARSCCRQAPRRSRGREAERRRPAPRAKRHSRGGRSPRCRRRTRRRLSTRYRYRSGV